MLSRTAFVSLRSVRELLITSLSHWQRKFMGARDGILFRVRINGSTLSINPFLRVHSLARSFVHSRVYRPIGGDLQLARTVIMRRWWRTVGTNRLTSFPEKDVETIIVQVALISSAFWKPKAFRILRQRWLFSRRF